MTNTRPTLLLVDDEPDLLLSLQGLLRQEFELYIANGGPAALEIIQSHTIQIVMSDQRMPGMSGDELLARIAQQSPNTVRILLTGYADIQDVIRALNTGGLFRYLTKPWDLDELIDVLQLAVEQYRQTIARIDRHQQTQTFTDDVVAFLQSQPESDQTANLIQRGITLPKSESDPR
jgi:response regulator RpfG family c-di-GMP phosphodiesterase